MHSRGQDRSLSMLWFYKINDVETHHAREKNCLNIYKCCCCQDYLKNCRTTRSSEMVCVKPWIAIAYICSVFFTFPVSSTKFKMAAKILNMSFSRTWTASLICFMFGLLERPYPGCVLISFWCDSDKKYVLFLRFKILADIFNFVSFWLFSCKNSAVLNNTGENANLHRRK